MSEPTPVATRCESQTLTAAVIVWPSGPVHVRTPAADGSRSRMRAASSGSGAPVNARCSSSASAAAAGGPRSAPGLGRIVRSATGSAGSPAGLGGAERPAASGEGQGEGRGDEGEGREAHAPEATARHPLNRSSTVAGGRPWTTLLYSTSPVPDTDPACGMPKEG